MCNCLHPCVNGQPGDYARYLAPPTPLDSDRIVYDEPGRCGSIDAHSHHFTLVESGFGRVELLYRHCAGEGRFRVSNGPAVICALHCLGTDGRYWVLYALYDAHASGDREGQAKADQSWGQSAAEKRIRTRKMPKSTNVKVWIEARPQAN